MLLLMLCFWAYFIDDIWAFFVLLEFFYSNSIIDPISTFFSKFFSGVNLYKSPNFLYIHDTYVKLFFKKKKIQSGQLILFLVVVQSTQGPYFGLHNLTSKLNPLYFIHFSWLFSFKTNN